MKKLFSLLTLALLTMSAWAATVTDVITAADLKATGSSYTDFSGVTFNTAVYAGQTAMNGTDIQMRSKNSNSGIVSTTSGGKLVSVKINVASNNSNTIDVYGSNTAYIAATNLYGNNGQGTKVGSTAETATIAVDGDYQYVGIRSNNGAVYISSIEITWETEGGTTPVVEKVAAPTFNPVDGHHFTGSLPVTVSCDTENASIYVYKMVNGEIDYNTEQYYFQTGTFYVNETATYAAQATKGGMEASEFTYVTYTLDNDNPDPQVTDYIRFNHGEDAQTAAGAFTVTRNGASFTVTNGMVANDCYRIYKDATITFNADSTVGNIVKIEFDGLNGSNPISGFGENEGLTFDGNNGTWTGEAKTVTLTVKTKQVRATEIRVYVDGEAPITVMDPTFDPSDGYTFTTETLDVTINCATQGATIVYVVNDGDEEEAAAPATVTLTGTSTILAYAKIGEFESNLVEATYTKEDPIQADYVTFNSETDKGNGSSTDTAPWTVVKDGVTMACSSGRVYDAGYRIYQGSTLKFTSTVGNIIRIEFDGVSEYPVSRMTANGGEFATSGVDGIWTGKTPEVIFTATQQARATEIRVYVDGDTTAVLPVEVATPVFTPAHNTTFIGSLEVSINCETEGAQIYYGFDNENFELYTAAFTIDQACTVYAYAQLDTVKSATASAKYYKALEVATIAEANGLKDKTNFAYTGSDAVVTYQWKNEKNQYVSTWIKDETGYGLIYGKQVPELTTGNVLNPNWDAQKITYNSIPEFQYPNNVTASGTTVTVEPVEMTQIDTTCVNMYIIMKGQTLTIDETDTTGCTWTNDAELKFYNQFFKTEGLNIESGKTYDVVGIATIHKKAPELYIISVTETVTGMRGDVNLDKQVTISDVTDLINCVLNNNWEGYSYENADCDPNGTVNIADVTALINYLLNNKVWPNE